MHSDRTEQIAFRALPACCMGHAACHLTMPLFPTLRLVMSKSETLRVCDVDWAYGACSMLTDTGHQPELCAVQQAQKDERVKRYIEWALNRSQRQSKLNKKHGR